MLLNGFDLFVNVKRRPLDLAGLFGVLLEGFGHQGSPCFVFAIFSSGGGMEQGWQ